MCEEGTGTDFVMEQNNFSASSVREYLNGEGVIWRVPPWLCCYFSFSIPLIQWVPIIYLVQLRHIAGHSGHRVQYDTFSCLKEKSFLYHSPNYHATVLDKGGQVSFPIQGEEMASQPLTLYDYRLCYLHRWVGTFGEKLWAGSPYTFRKVLHHLLCYPTR